MNFKKYFNVILVPILLHGLFIPSARASENTYLDTRAGSLSPWSLQFLMNYSGASLETPFSSEAPNPAQDLVAPRVQLGGSVALRYRASPSLSYGLGTGLQADTPFHGAQNSSLSNPLLDISWFDKSKNLFVSSSILLYTDPVYRNYFYHSNFALSISTHQQFLNWPQWGWGAQLGLARNFFDSNQGYQLESSIGVYPSLDYQMSDALSLRSVLTLGSYQTITSAEWKPSKLSQTLGLGWIPQRDIFLYSYILFYPSPLAELNSKESSIGFSLTLNVF